MAVAGAPRVPGLTILAALRALAGIDRLPFRQIKGNDFSNCASAKPTEAGETSALTRRRGHDASSPCVAASIRRLIALLIGGAAGF